MGDRIRLGEVLAAIGAVGLTVMLVIGTWLQYRIPGLAVPGLLSDQVVVGGLGVLGLGWFVALLLAFAAIAGLAFIFRVLTATDTERPMLQAPIAYAAALIATPVLLLRLTLLRPDATDVGSVTGPGGAAIEIVGAYPTTVPLGGWLGLLFLMLLLLGTWHAMEDERKHTPFARKQTAELMGAIARRPVPRAEPEPAPAGAATLTKQDAAASAEGQLPTEDDPATPTKETP